MKNFPRKKVLMEISPPSTRNKDSEATAIQGLVETFGSFFSIDEITSAYRNAGRNTDLASQILSFSEPRTNGGCLENGFYSERPSIVGKKEYRPVSRGTLRRDIGRDNQSPPTKPVRIDEMVIPTCVPSKPIQSEVFNKDLESFMRKMLGDGFKLDDNDARHVFDQCGFDMQKEMESLADLSIETSISKENPIPTENIDLPNAEDCKPKSSLSEDIKLSLFKGPKPFENVKPNRLSRRQKTRSIALGKLVKSVSSDTDDEKPSVTSICGQAIADEEDDSYVSLLNVRKEYRATMKEYYKAAIAAFLKGDSARAERLMEQGNFYSTKAREADEESERLIFKPRNNSEERSELLLDLHAHDPKEAISILNLHLSSAQCFDVLKVVIEKSGEKDASKGARRRLVRKFLEKKELQFIDGENGETILIQLNQPIEAK